jgi:hypothetical protein
MPLMAFRSRVAYGNFHPRDDWSVRGNPVRYLTDGGGCINQLNSRRRYRGHPACSIWPLACFTWALLTETEDTIYLLPSVHANNVIFETTVGKKEKLLRLRYLIST